MNQQKSFLLALCIVLAMPAASALAQIGRGAGGIGGRGAIGGVRPGLSSPRSGLGVRSNPIVNPAPSLTPHEVLNPRGSLSSGQVLNPAPSVLRPRSGGTTPTAPQSVTPGTPQSVTTGARQSVTTGRGEIGRRASGGSRYRNARPVSGISMADDFDQLGNQLRNHKNGDSWAQYLALPKDGNGEATLGKLLRRFERVSSNPAYAKVTAIPAFKAAHEALKREVAGTALGELDPTRRTGGEWILQSVVALDHELEQLSPDGAWSKRLSLDELRIAIPVLSEQPANDSERKSLEKIVSTFQDVAEDENAADVHQLADFKETLRALQAYLKSYEPPASSQDLSLSLDQLSEELRDFRNGDSWAEYLSLPKELGDGEPTQAAREPTQKLLKRFDKLTSDPTYQPVTTLVAFQPAHEALKVAADQADTLPPPTTVASADKPPVTPTDAKPAPAKKSQPVTADKKPAAVNKKPVPAADKKAVAAVDKKPAEPRPSAPETTEPRPIDPPPAHQSVGERVLKAAVALKTELEQVAPDKGWPKRLSLADLGVTVSMTSDQPRSDADRKSVEGVVKTFQEIANNKDDAAITQLAEFKETLEALQQYLKPTDTPPSKD